uniref:Uncharacterized protein n=1 Tax=viral metagenome TaxID=1070528 RepID=A0A6M3L4P5_9ZZZZ
MNVYDEITALGMWGLANEAAVPCGGDVFYVDGNSGNAANTAISGQGDSWDMPFSTVNYAISRCSNNAGNIIFVAADHTETIADTNDSSVSGTTTDEFCVDKSGVTIIGLGSGTRRPTFTLNGATDACIDVRSANCRMYNLIFYNTQDGNVAMLSAQSGADGLVLENCMFYESANDAEPIRMVNIAANCDDVTIRGCRFYNVAGGDQILSAIDLVGATTRTKIVDNVFRGDWNEHVIDGDAAAGYDIEIMDNFILNSDATVGSVIALNDSTTGVVSGNAVHGCAGTAGGPIIAAGCLISNNYVTINEGQNAELWPGGIGGTKVGNHWYVDSGTGKAAGTGLSWADAVSTVDVAIGLATADNGDVIHVAAGHTEDITGATTFILDVDKAGLTIIGEGTGRSRPTFTMKSDTANANVDVSADDVRLSNLIFNISTTDSNKYWIIIDGVDCEIDHCEFAGNASQQCLTAITIAGASDNLADNCYIHDNVFRMEDAGPNSAIDIIKDEDGIRIENNYIRGNFSNACIEVDAGGDACTDLVIRNNVLINEQTGDHCIEISGVTVTGLIEGNTFISDTRDQVAQPSLCQMVNNKWSKLGTGMKGIDNVDPVNAGIHIFVDSGATGAADTAGHGYSWDEPLATLDDAIALCTANAGDIIHLAPGHAENVATAGAITCDIAGITIKGHGQGTDRPTFTFITNNTADIEIDAANVTFENIIFIGDKDGLAAPLDVDAAHCTFRNCVFRDLGTDNCTDWIVCDANADYLTVEDCVNEGTDTAANASWIQLDGSEYATIRRNFSHGDFSVANIGVVNTAVTHLLITDNHLINLNAVDVNIEGFAGSTGIIARNCCEIPTDAQTTWINTPGACTLFENYGANQDGETGKLCGTASE